MAAATDDETRAAAIARLQAHCRALVGPDRNIVDEFIAERRREAERE
ncbi:hypothetical protein [Oleomonas cavernae]|nr:hypothetical protein [Oleomonas cavernae]